MKRFKVLKDFKKYKQTQLVLTSDLTIKENKNIGELGLSFTIKSFSSPLCSTILNLTRFPGETCMGKSFTFFFLSPSSSTAEPYLEMLDRKVFGFGREWL